MTPHDEAAELLALSAAGMLEPSEERLLREHLRDCAECAAREVEFRELAAGLGTLAAPLPAPDLVARTQALLAADLAARADRRQGELLAGAAGVVAWGMTFVAWYVYRRFTGGGLVGELALWSISVSIEVIAAAALVRGRRLQRNWL